MDSVSFSLHCDKHLTEATQGRISFTLVCFSGSTIYCGTSHAIDKGERQDEGGATRSKIHL